MSSFNDIQNNTLFNYMNNVSEFKTELLDISKKWDQLILLSQLSSTTIDLSDTKNNFNTLTSELISQLSDATIKKVISEMTSKAQVSVDIVIRNLFERTADIGFFATDDDIRKYLLNLPKYKKQLIALRNEADEEAFNNLQEIIQKEKSSLHQRFQEYVAKYSVYYDIVLFDTKGKIVKRLDKGENNKVKSTTDEIIKIAQLTKEEYVETYRYHDFLSDQIKSLVYTYRVTKDNESDEIIGYLSLCFKFQNEMKGIFDELITKENKEVITLLDTNKTVIATSDKYHIPIDAPLEIEVDNEFAISQFGGRDYIIKTCKTNGYEGFYGLGWMGHIMIPVESAFNMYTKEIKIQQDVLSSIMQNENLFKKELLAIPQKAEVIQKELDRAVWNGSLLNYDENTSQAEFSKSILREVKSTGEKTKTTFSTSIEKLNQTIISSLLNNVTFLASLSMDIMDRNLYERANDCRWWALTSTFKELLKKGSYLNQDDLEKMTSILQYINSLYTVYTNLFIYDTSGTIIAVSNKKYNSLINTRLQEKWIDNTLKIKDSSKYFVSYFDKTFLYDDRYTFIFNAAINDEDTKNLGGIGIVFDCEDQFKTMLQDALPIDSEGNIQEGYFSLYVEKYYSIVLSCSDDSHQVGDKFQIDPEFLELKPNESLSKIVKYNDKYYLVGAKCSKGYREFKGENDSYQKEVLAFVFVEAGKVLNEKELENSINSNNHYIYPSIPGKELVEVATFYIDNKWLGIKTDDVIEAVTIDNLEKPITMESNHHFKGTISHKKYLVSVLDISPFIDSHIQDGKKEIIIVKYDQSGGDHTIGIVADKLGDMVRVPKYKVRPFEKHLIGGGMLGESIVQPPDGHEGSSLLTLLNISKLSSLDEYNPMNSLKD